LQQARNSLKIQWYANLKYPNGMQKPEIRKNPQNFNGFADTFPMNGMQ